MSLKNAVYKLYSVKMGIYFRTVFYKDVRQRDRGFIILADIDPIIEETDRERGYVLKDDLMKFYGLRIKFEDIGEYSRIEEQLGSSYGPSYETQISLPIH